MEPWQIVVLIVSILLALGIGVAAGYFIRVKTHEKSLAESRAESQKIVDDGTKEAERIKRENILEAKQEIHDLKKDFENDSREKRQVLDTQENKLNQREEMLNNRTNNLDRREETLLIREEKLEENRRNVEQLNSKVDAILREQEEKLIEISGITKEEAGVRIMAQVREDMDTEVLTYIRDEEERAKNEARNKAKNILSLAIQKYAAETAAETTVSVVDLPSDEMKGRIIGREGRNIRTFEALTGVDLIIDDTPNAAVISGFDPVRRAVAKKSLETLVSDGRIHPGRIEEIVNKTQEEIQISIHEAGEAAVFETGIGRMNIELIKILGRLKYRTSYGQNVLRHSIEVGMLAGKLAVELGEDELLARRAGLMHDIGKALDHEIQGSHTEIGINIAKRYKEPKEVIDAIASHHGDAEPQTMIAVLVAAADALSAARPGARNESVENYIQRLTKLEELSNSVAGVEQAYAIQAGREIRVMVKPNEIDDLSAIKVAREIKEKIEENMTYPGTIKVTVIRETRATDIAK